VSPVVAQRGFSNRDPHLKTAGETLAHFSGFFRKTWRSNDILWGRLDTVCELAETLFTPQAVAEAMAREPARQHARATLLPSDGTPSPLEGWFAHSSAAAVEGLKAWVDQVTSDDNERRNAAATNVPLERLIEMAQFEILHTCLPQVFEDSIAEQASACQRRRRRRREPDRLEWLGTDAGIGEGALEAIAQIGGKRILEELAPGRPQEESPRDSRLGQSFMSSYRVGTDGVFDGGVPPLVLADILSRAALVMRNCAVGALGENAARNLRATMLYRWTLDMPLRALRGLIVFLKSAPGFETAVFAGVTILSVLALVVGLNWKDAILRPGGQLNFMWFAVFIVVPLVWLSVSGFQLSRSRLRRTGLSDAVRDAFVFICASAPLISVTLLYFGLTDLMWDWWSGTSEPVANRNIQILMVLLYGIVPFVLSFVGGYMAVRSRGGDLEAGDYMAVLARVTEAELQDISDRLGEQHRVTPDSRLAVAKALTVAAEMTNNLGKLDRAIRATCPGLLD
jgi:hypothetical protein